MPLKEKIPGEQDLPPDIMTEQIKNYLNRYVVFDDREAEEFCSCLVSETYKKKDFLLKEGEVCRHKIFIQAGLVRSFYTGSNGNEQIVQFGIENWWVICVESFVKETPSEVNIQALEETTVFMISKDSLENLYHSVPRLERFFRIITENMLIALQRRDGYYMKMSSKERYEFLVKSIPDFVQRVPQYMIASYLEISPEYLSELRKKS